MNIPAAQAIIWAKRQIVSPRVVGICVGGMLALFIIGTR
jgi:hypothetical protein